MARRIAMPVEHKPARLDLRDVLPDWLWRNGPDFEIWGGTILGYVPADYRGEFDRRFMYRVDGDGGWAQGRAA